MAVKTLSVLLLLAVAALETFKKVNADMRVDNIQDPVMTVTVGSGLDSALFDSCVTQSFTLSARFSSIQSSAGQIYNRYVPSITYNVTFITANSTTPIKNIIDCADYAGSIDASMFMYDGSKCQYVNRAVYDMSLPEDCGSAEKPAVFVQYGFYQTTCFTPLPSFPFVNGTDKYCILPLVTQTLYAKASCGMIAGIFGGRHVTYQNIKPYLISMGVVSDLFFDYYLHGTGWAVGNDSDITAQDFASGSYPAVSTIEDPHSSSGTYILYMSAADGFKLKMGPKATTMAGVLCEAPCLLC